MSNSRRNFCKNSVLFGLGLSFSPLITHAKTNQSISKKVLNLKKNAQKSLKVSGKICYEDLSPVQNATIEIWHNNSESNPSKFEYEGKLITDSEGNYQFETDFPEKHFEEGNYRMRRIFFKIKPKNGEETLTKLYFGTNEKAFIDNHHFEKTNNNFREELPKTKDENENLKSIQFNIYLNF
jgi:protocatechuate 3,4-dioxygenase beta subunit